MDPQQAQATTDQTPITVQVEGLGTVQFPAGTDQDTMKKAIDAQLAKAHVNKSESVPHPIVARLLDWLPAAGATVGGILGGAAGIESGPGAIATAAGGATLGGGAGESMRQNINRIVGNPAPASATEAAKDIGKAGVIGGASDLIGGLTTKALAAGLAPLMRTEAGALMQSAVKPGIKATAKAMAGNADPASTPIVKTLLNEGVNVTPGGIEKLTRIIKASNDDIKAALDAVPGDVRLDPGKIAARVDPLIERASKQANPEADVKMLREAKEEFLRKYDNPTSILKQEGPTVIEGQASKQATYKALGEKAYGELKGPQIEAQKALARGYKEDIAEEAAKYGADINAPNAREGAAITTRDAVARRVAAAGNRDPIALAWLAHNPTAGLLFLMERSPAVKSMLARGLYKSAALAARVPENVVKTLVQAVSTAGEPEK